MIDIVTDQRYIGSTEMTENPKKLVIVGTDDLIGQLSSCDSRDAERAFNELRRRIGEVKSRVYYAANRVEDPNALSYLVELLGESTDPKYLPFIVKQLKSDHARVRLFAHAALFRLGTPRSRELYHNHNLRRLLSGARPKNKQATE